MIKRDEFRYDKINRVAVSLKELTEARLKVETFAVGQSYRNGGIAIISFIDENIEMVNGQEYFVGILISDGKKIVVDNNSDRKYVTVFVSKREFDGSKKCFFFCLSNHDKLEGHFISFIEKSGYDFKVLESVGFYTQRKNPIL